MNLIQKYSGVVALVILAIMGLMGMMSGGSTQSGGTTLGSTSCGNITCLSGGLRLVSDAGGDFETDIAAVFNSTVSMATASMSGLLTLDGGLLHSYASATSSTATSVTLKQADIVNFDTVLYTPTVAAVTVTFPASSTLTSMVPNAGDTQDQCWINATSTAAATITFAEGTGVILQVASSTTNIGDQPVRAGGTACFHFIRKTNTDINAVFTRYVDIN